MGKRKCELPIDLGKIIKKQKMEPLKGVYINSDIDLDILKRVDHRTVELLDMPGSSLNKIPKTMKNLKALNCSSCRCLKKIPNLKHLEYLDCSYSLVEFIPRLKNLKILNVYGCKNISYNNIPLLIKYFPKLEKVLTDTDEITIKRERYFN